MNVIEAAKFHLDTIVILAEAGMIKWREEAPPKPEAIRAFSASTSDYQIMVGQANVKNGFEPARVIHEGIAIASSGGPLVIRIPPEIANKLYHMAAAKRN